MADTSSIHMRMAAVMKAVRGVAKSAFNPQGSYKYAGHEQVTAALRDEYVAAGILRTASIAEWKRETGTISLLVAVRWTNRENSSDFVEVKMLGECPPVTRSGAPTGQQAGIALSYAVKMAELKAFSLTGDDTPNPEAQDKTNEAVGDFVAQFAECQTVQEIEALSLEIRQAGAAVAGHRDELLKARSEAMARVR